MNVLVPSSRQLRRSAMPFPLAASMVEQEAPYDLDEARQRLSAAQMRIQKQEEKISQLESLAMTDELTGLINGRAMMMLLRRELAAARRDKRNGGFFIIASMDDCGQINDLYGRHVMDAYLQTAASVLVNEVRGTDFVARMGDDSFGILMTQIVPRDAALRLDRLDNVFNKRVMHSRQQALALKASFGYALLVETETAESLTVVADAKLYANKARRKMGMS